MTKSKKMLDSLAEGSDSIGERLQRARAGDKLAGLEYLVMRAAAGVASARLRQHNLKRKRAIALKTLERFPSEFATSNRTIRQKQAALRSAKQRLADMLGGKS